MQQVWNGSAGFTQSNCSGSRGQGNLEELKHRRSNGTWPLHLAVRDSFWLPVKKKSLSAVQLQKLYHTLVGGLHAKNVVLKKHQNRSFVDNFFFFTWTDLQENLCSFKRRPCVQTFGFCKWFIPKYSTFFFFLQSQPIATTHLQLLECKSCRLLWPSELCPQKCFGLDFSPPVGTVAARFFLYCF